MTRVDKGDVLAALTPDAVAAAYGIAGRWSGRWMRAARCPTTTHGTGAFGVSREGKWHCHACNVGGGDLLSMIAACEGLDCARDFQAVLEIAATIAGVEPEADFGAPAPLRRPTTRPAVQLPPLTERIRAARARAEWVWSHLKSPDQIGRVRATGRHPFLADRGLVWRDLPDHARVNVRELGFWTIPGAYEELLRACAIGSEPDPKRASDVIKRIYSSPECLGGVGIAVRHVQTGDLVDVRARRAEVADGAPKILGLPGGVTSCDGELIGCYGNPHALAGDAVVVVEGWADYLTAAWRWPKADVLGAVDAGSYPLVASFAARYLAERGHGTLWLVVQADVPGRNPDGSEKPGAAALAAAVALKRAGALLPFEAIEILHCDTFEPFAPHKVDLNDLVCAGHADELPEIAP